MSNVRPGAHSARKGGLLLQSVRVRRVVIHLVSGVKSKKKYFLKNIGGGELLVEWLKTNFGCTKYGLQQCSAWKNEKTQAKITYSLLHSHIWHYYTDSYNKNKYYYTCDRVRESKENFCPSYHTYKNMYVAIWEEKGMVTYSKQSDGVLCLCMLK